MLLLVFYVPAGVEIPPSSFGVARLEAKICGALLKCYAVQSYPALPCSFLEPNAQQDVISRRGRVRSGTVKRGSPSIENQKHEFLCFEYYVSVRLSSQILPNQVLPEADYHRSATGRDVHISREAIILHSLAPSFNLTTRVHTSYPPIVQKRGPCILQCEPAVMPTGTGLDVDMRLNGFDLMGGHPLRFGETFSPPQSTHVKSLAR